jgi:two-component system, cell cycle sensor histidine kinase and response regulator CckA
MVRILSVDDNSDILFFLSHLLKEAGYEVIEAATGEECLRLAREQKPDLILLDVVLPDIDGIEVCKRIKEDPELSYISVINFSARRTSSSNLVEGLRAGADLYMAKPIEPDELLAQVQAILRNKSNSEVLRESEERYRATFEFAAIGIAHVGLNGELHVVNQKLCEILGYPREELMEKTFQDITFPDDLPNYFKYIPRLLEGELKTFIVDQRYIRKDGSIIWANLTVSLVRDHFEKPKYFIYVIEDISRRKWVEERAREQAALLNIAQDAILVIDLEDRILFWNKGARRVYGWSAEEAIGENASRLLLKNDLTRLLEARKGVMEGEEWMGELSQVTKEGKEVVVESRWTLVRDELGEPKSFLIVNTDITEKKQLQSQFLRAQRMESVGTLASGIAHDLNNILTPILMSVQLLNKRIEDEQSRQILSTLEATTLRGADLVRQVVSFSRGIEGNKSIVQISPLIQEVEKIVKELFPRSINVRTDIEKNLWAVSADSVQLHQVLMNLCVNARDAMAGGGTISISARNFFIDENFAMMNVDADPGPYILITITDTGTGIPTENLDKVFEPFFTTKEIGKGTGLGLSTVIGITKTHGGFVKVNSEVGKGTEFKVYLPAIESDELGITRAARTASESPAGHDEVILVVDDEASILEITRASLEAYNYRVLTANDGIEAVAIFAENKDKIGIVLLDMMMPLMDGPATIRALQRIDPQVKIIAASGLLSSDKINEITRNGIKTFLSKPYTADELLKALQEVFQS